VALVVPALAVRLCVLVSAVVRIRRALARPVCVRRLGQVRVQVLLPRRPLAVPWADQHGLASDTYRVA
jgi:hypothetical protein